MMAISFETNSIAEQKTIDTLLKAVSVDPESVGEDLQNRLKAASLAAGLDGATFNLEILRSALIDLGLYLDAQGSEDLAAKNGALKELGETCAGFSSDCQTIAEATSNHSELLTKINGKLKSILRQFETSTREGNLRVSSSADFLILHELGISVARDFGNLASAIAANIGMLEPGSEANRIGRAFEDLSKTAAAILEVVDLFASTDGKPPNKSLEQRAREISPDGESLGRLQGIAASGLVNYLWAPWVDDPGDPHNDEKRDAFLRRADLSWRDSIHFNDGKYFQGDAPKKYDEVKSEGGQTIGYICSSNVFQEGYDVAAESEAARAQLSGPVFAEAPVLRGLLLEKMSSKKVESTTTEAQADAIESLCRSLYEYQGGEGLLPGVMMERFEGIRLSRLYSSAGECNAETDRRKRSTEKNSEYEAGAGKLTSGQDEVVTDFQRFTANHGAKIKERWDQLTADLSQDELVLILGGLAKGLGFEVSQLGQKATRTMHQLNEYISGEWQSELDAARDDAIVKGKLATENDPVFSLLSSIPHAKLDEPPIPATQKMAATQLKDLLWRFFDVQGGKGPLPRPIIRLAQQYMPKGQQLEQKGRTLLQGLEYGVLGSGKLTKGQTYAAGDFSRWLSTLPEALEKKWSDLTEDIPDEQLLEAKDANGDAFWASDLGQKIIGKANELAAYVDAGLRDATIDKAQEYFDLGQELTDADVAGLEKDRT